MAKIHWKSVFSKFDGIFLGFLLRFFFDSSKVSQYVVDFIRSNSLDHFPSWLFHNLYFDSIAYRITNGITEHTDRESVNLRTRFWSMYRELFFRNLRLLGLSGHRSLSV